MITQTLAVSFRFNGHFLILAVYLQNAEACGMEGSVSGVRVAW